MLEAIAEDVWVAAGSHRLLPGVHFPTRMVVVRKPNGGLVLHSPVELSKALVDELGRLGPVDLLIAPNSFHYAHLAAARRSFPSAHLIGPDALRAKAPDVALDTTLEESHRSGGEPFDGVFELLPLRGAPKMEEWLFLHAASETLVVTDLLFNVQDPKGALTPWVLRAAGAYRKPSISRLVKTMVNDETTFLASLDEALEHQPKRLVMAHGTIVESDATDVLREAVRRRFGRPRGA